MADKYNHSLLLSGEDYLLTQSIPTLRNLIGDLQENALGKQSELQLLVGSYYHDFIQSADAIASMATKAQLMDEKVSKLWGYSQSLIDKTQELIDFNDFEKDEASIYGDLGLSGRVAASNRRLELSSAEVWSYLENLDVFSASKVVYLSNFILFLNDGKSITSPHLYNLVHSHCSIANVADSTQLKDAHFAVFLKETVVEDCNLLLLDENLDPHSKARTLSALSLLSGVSRASLLSKHLACVDISIEHCISQISTGNRESDFVSEQLSALVTILQEALLDIYILFYKVFERSYEELIQNGRVLSSTSKALPFSHTGLLSVYQSQMLNDIAVQLTKASKPTNASTYASANRSEAKPFLLVNTFIQSEKNQTSQFELRKILDQWLTSIVRKISEKISMALGSMTSASEVSKLQQKLWIVSTNLLPRDDDLKKAKGFNEANESPDTSRMYSQDDWVNACAELLVSTTKSQQAPAGDAVAPANLTTLLWSLIFRGPFLSQVERLLRESCSEVFNRVKSRLVYCLAAEGLVVDTSHVRPVVTVASVGGSKRFDDTASDGNAAKLSLGKNTNTVSKQSPRYEIVNPVMEKLTKINSARLFNAAEGIRSLLEREISDVLGAVILPVQEGDSQSLQALSRVLFIQSSQLVARILIYIRELIQSIDGQFAEAKAAAKESVGLSALSSGILLLGRIAWLMKIRGRFLESILTLPSESGLDSLNEFDLSTEDQLLSAFEIADTNGDGIVSYNEAIEAIQALAISSLDASSGYSTILVSPQATPSASFSEFALLCANFLTQKDLSRSVGRLCSALDDLIDKSHQRWTASIVDTLSDSLAAAVKEEMLLVQIFAKSTPAFKSLWKDVVIDHETISLPTVASGPIQRYIAAINFAISSIVTIDTVQHLPLLVQRTQQYVTKVTDLLQFIKSSVYISAFAAVVALYRKLLEEALAMESSRQLKSEDIEDMALQCTFDLIVLELLFTQVVRDIGHGSRCSELLAHLKVVISDWRSHIDPINVLLIESTFASSAAICFNKLRLIGVAVVTTPIDVPSSGSSVEPIATSTSGSSNSTTKDASAKATTAMDMVFSSATAPRFGLLPLPMSMSAASASSSSMLSTTGKSSYGAGTSSAILSDDAVKAASNSKATAGGPAKSLIGSLSTSISNIGSIGNIGNFLGTSGSSSGH